MHSESFQGCGLNEFAASVVPGTGSKAQAARLGIGDDGCSAAAALAAAVAVPTCMLCPQAMPVLATERR